jgi:hypothetical protein
VDRRDLWFQPLGPARDRQSEQAQE